MWHLHSRMNIPSLETRVNTLRPRRNGQHFADDIFKRNFFNENVWISIKISLKFVPKGPVYNIPAFREWLGAVQATSHCLNQWLIVYRRIYAWLGLNELTTHYRANFIITVRSWWARWCLKSPASRLFVQAQVRENIKALRHWPFWGEFTGDRWIPLTKGQ